MLYPKNFDIIHEFPQLSRKLRLGVVGGGRISGMQAMAARLSNRWEIVAGAFSSDATRAKAAAQQWFLPEDRCYLDYKEMAQSEAMRDDGVDAVMITTPNHLHCDAAEAFLTAGIHVLCDKPLTNSTADADKLVALTQQSGCVFGVSYVMSCFPMIRQAREIIADGGIGNINQIHTEFMQDWMIPDNAHDAKHVQWRLDTTQSGPTSCVGDIGTHAAHLASFVSHLALSDIRAEFHICGADKPLEDTFFAWTRYRTRDDCDVPGTMMATRLASGNRGGLRLRIFGDEGAIEWDLEQCDYLKFNRYGEADRMISRGHGHGVSPHVEKLIRSARGFGEGIIEAWANLYTEFAMAVAANIDDIDLPQNALNMPYVADGALGIYFIDACVRSHKNASAWVTLNPTPS